MPRILRAIRSKIVLFVLIMCIAGLTVAQDTVSITLFIDQNALTLYVPNPAQAGLQNLAFKIDERTHSLSDFTSFNVSSTSNPVCFRLIKVDERVPLPLECNPENTSIQTQSLSAADIFWNDEVAGINFSVLLTQGEEGELIGVCGAGHSDCEMTYTPLPFTLENTPPDDEILIILSKFRQLNTDSEPELVLEYRLNQALEAARERGVNVRIQPIFETILDREHARQVAESFGATMLIWGVIEPAGLDVNYEILETEERRISTQVESTSFQTSGSLDEVDIRISNPIRQQYVLNFTIGQILYFDEQYNAAIPFFEDAIELVQSESEDRLIDLSLEAAYFYLGRSFHDTTGVIDVRHRYQQAIVAYETALTYQNPEVMPLNYTLTQNNLGLAYVELARIENSRENLSVAIGAYNGALRYQTPEAVPLDYATTQNNLGIAYLTLSAIENGRENLRLAIDTYTEALRYQTPYTVPLNYSRTQNNLGIAYATLSAIENEHENLRLAIDAYTEALRYQTPEMLPLDYAQTQGNVGVAYHQQNNVEAACAAWQEALQIYQEQDIQARVEVFTGIIEQVCTEPSESSN